MPNELKPDELKKVQGFFLRSCDSRWASLAVAVAVSIVVYSNSLGNGFVYDDGANIIKNETIKDLANLPALFFSDKSVKMAEGTNFYRPVSFAFYALDYHLFGLEPWGYHLSYILMHALATAAVFLFAARLFAAVNGSGRTWVAPLAVAILFATHPVNTEVVAWNGADSMLLTALMLFSLNCYMAGRHVAACILFFLAALSRETAMILPFLLVAYDLSFKADSLVPLTKEKFARAVRRYLPYVAVGALYMALRTYAIKGFAGTDMHPELSFYESLINIPPIFAEYLWLLLYPVNLTVAHTFYPVHSVFEWKSLVGLLAVFLFCFIAYAAYRRERVVFFSLLLVAAPLLPVFYVPALGVHAVAERRLYLSTVGFALIFVYLASAVWTRYSAARPVAGRVALAAVVTVILVFSVATVKRSAVWKSDLTLWEDTVVKSPGDRVAHYNLGRAYQEVGGEVTAAGEYLLAIEIDPDYGEAHYNLAMAYYRLDQLPGAMEMFERATVLMPGISMIHFNLASVYHDMGRLDDAVREYAVSIGLNPTRVEPRTNLAIAFATMGRLDEAIAEFKKVTRLMPGSAMAHYDLALAYKKKGLIVEAVREADEALRLDPLHSEAFMLRNSLEVK